MEKNKNVLKVKDIWTIIKESQIKNDKTIFKQSQEVHETNVLFLGTKQSGKTSLIHKILGKDMKNIEPSIALEYCYGKRENKLQSYVGNFWELAGGTSLLELVDEVLTVSNIHSFIAVIVVDLTKEERVFSDCVKFLRYLSRISKKYFKFMMSKKSKIPSKILARIKKRFGEKHKDLKKIRFSGIPTIIIGNKFDQFQNQDQKKLKLMAKSLRFLSHSYGCSLLYTGMFEDKKLDDINKKSLRDLMNSLIFGTQLTMSETLIDEKFALRVIAGKDSFLAVEENPLIVKKRLKDVGFEELKADARMYKWYENYANLFGVVEKDADEEAVKLNFEYYKEEKIDAVRKQKDEELRQYRRDLERKRKKMERGKKRKNQLKKKI